MISRFILILYILSGFAFAKNTHSSKEKFDLSRDYHRADLLLVGDGSGFSMNGMRRKYDYAKWYILDPRRDWTSPESKIWEWDPLAEPTLSAVEKTWFVGSRDGKFVDDGRAVLLVASNGGVALVQIHPKKLLFYTSVGRNTNPHSADLLPDGNIVVVSSFSQKLTVISTDERVSTFPNSVHMKEYAFPSAHGVVWDEKREVVWVLGTKLSIFEYNGISEDPRLLKVRDLLLPADGSGHDLFPTRHGDRFFITTNKWTGTFDPEHEVFEAFESFEEMAVKALSQGRRWSAVAYTFPVADPTLSIPNQSWWTPTVSFINRHGRKATKTLKGARIYKARWSKAD